MKFCRKGVRSFISVISVYTEMHEQDLRKRFLRFVHPTEFDSPPFGCAVSPLQAADESAALAVLASADANLHAKG